MKTGNFWKQFRRAENERLSNMVIALFPFVSSIAVLNLIQKQRTTKYLRGVKMDILDILILNARERETIE